MLFLTPKELHELTGLTQPAAQYRWLKAHGWRVEVDAQKRPKVARAYFDHRMMHEKEQADAKPRQNFSVNVAALKNI